MDLSVKTPNHGDHLESLSDRKSMDITNNIDSESSRLTTDKKPLAIPFLTQGSTYKTSLLENNGETKNKVAKYLEYKEISKDKSPGETSVCFKENPTEYCKSSHTNNNLKVFESKTLVASYQSCIEPVKLIKQEITDENTAIEIPSYDTEKRLLEIPCQPAVVSNRLREERTVTGNSYENSTIEQLSSKIGKYGTTIELPGSVYKKSMLEIPYQPVTNSNTISIDVSSWENKYQTTMEPLKLPKEEKYDVSIDIPAVTTKETPVTPFSVVSNKLFNEEVSIENETNATEPKYHIKVEYPADDPYEIPVEVVMYPTGEPPLENLNQKPVKTKSPKKLLEVPVSCEQCSAKFSRKDSLKRHIGAVHNKVRPFKCHLCPSTFPEKNAMLRHIGIVHEGLQPFTCKSCGESFSSKYHLDKHVRGVHENVAPYTCDVCSTTFTGKQGMLRHFQAVHENLRPFVCNLCSAAFSTKSDMQAHVKRVHEKLRPFSCKLCSTKFSSKSDERAHIKAVHEKVRPFHCMICLLPFLRKQHLRRHLRAVHGIRSVGGDDGKEWLKFVGGPSPFLNYPGSESSNDGTGRIYYKCPNCELKTEDVGLFGQHSCSMEAAASRGWDEQDSNNCASTTTIAADTRGVDLIKVEPDVNLIKVEPVDDYEAFSENPPSNWNSFSSEIVEIECCPSSVTTM